jgi:hypothetical protein
MTDWKLVTRSSIIWTSTTGLCGVITCDHQRKAGGTPAPTQLGGITEKKTAEAMNAQEKVGFLVD